MIMITRIMLAVVVVVAMCGTGHAWLLSFEWVGQDLGQLSPAVSDAVPAADYSGMTASELDAFFMPSYVCLWAGPDAGAVGQYSDDDSYGVGSSEQAGADSEAPVFKSNNRNYTSVRGTDNICFSVPDSST